MFRITMILFLMFISLLSSVEFELSKISFAQIIYILYYYFPIITIALFLYKSNYITKISSKIRVSINIFKVISFIVFLGFVVTLDVIKDSIFRNKVIYFPSYYIYVVILIFLWDIFFDKKYKRNDKEV